MMQTFGDVFHDFAGSAIVHSVGGVLALVGAIALGPRRGKYGTNGFAVTNLSLRATKDIRVTDSFSIPVFGQLTGNPCSQKAYLVLGFTLQPSL